MEMVNTGHLVGPGRRPQSRILRCLYLLKARVTCVGVCGQPSFRYSLRLQLATHEGVRDTSLQYARMLARKMDNIEETIVNRGVALNIILYYLHKVFFSGQ